MLDHVTFQTDLFDRGLLLEPEITGEHLARWLHYRLAAVPSLTVLDEASGEDWGWCLPVRCHGVRLQIGCSLCPDCGDGCDCKPTRWMAFVFCDVEGFKRLLHRPVDDAKRELAQHLHAILGGCEEVLNVRWYEKDQVRAADWNHWQPSPAVRALAL